MSLSKYYKDSSSFKREKLVKANTPDQTGWQSTESTPATPFKPGGLNSIHKEIKPTRPAPATTNKTADPPPPPVNNTKEPAVDELPVDSPIDLSNYVTLEESEKNATERYQEGIQEGMQKATEDFGSALKTLTSITEQLDTIRETIIANSSNEVTEFAILIAEKILRFSLKDQDHSVIATIQEALSRAVKSDEFTIFIHPDDYQILADKSADLIAGVSGLTNIVIKTDPKIEQGGAKIESENCIIDATVASQFETIRDEILKSKG